ncbi:MAG: TraB/GumN family protein [Euryarchaeota archaeon]|nr:TraB/GumN family protein [Euryarchaeota archaeon]
MPVILVGTAHVSEKSVALVRETLERERPEVVALELDAARFEALRGEPRPVAFREALRGGKLYFLLAQWLMAYVQKRAGAEVGVEPGAEMKAAAEAAEKMGLGVALVDREIGITLGRFWGEMGFREKLRMFRAILGAVAGRGEEVDLERITEKEVVSSILEELRRFSPTAARVLIDERDAYIAGKLRELEAGGRRVVAVVGAGHVEGIQRLLDNPGRIPPLEGLRTIPRRRVSISRVVGIGLLALIFLFFAAILTALPLETFLAAFGVWAVATGASAALGAAAAGGHPLSVLTAFALAWFGVLHPLLATGWFSGLVEAKLRTPQVQDFRRLMDVNDLGGLLGNKVFRILLVAALTNLGAMLGGWIVGPAVVLRVTGVDIIATFRRAIFGG